MSYYSPKNLVRQVQLIIKQQGKQQNKQQSRKPSSKIGERERLSISTKYPVTRKKKGASTTFIINQVNSKQSRNLTITSKD